MQTMLHNIPGTLVFDAKDLGKIWMESSQWRHQMQVR